ncbi:MAG: DUF362 domain-containing protein, partial [Candidatus Cloacimonetes bacterium]|nr:DUF362 domain-containing protein [Candidatus Cloacimonadota bacterium]
MIVQIRKIEDYNLSEIEEAISRWFSCARNPKLKRARKVLIKPNLLGAFAPERAVTTHPLVVEAIARYFLSKNKSIIIADSNGGSANLDRVLTTCGYNYLAEKYPIRIINLSTYGVSSKDRNQYTLKISKIIGECGALINVGKLKTHSLVAYTGAIKNLYGLIPGLTKSEYHKQYPDTGSFSGLLNALYLELRD